jgi:RNA-binding protein
MEMPILTGRQKSHLRGLGQQLEASLKLGKAGLTPAFFEELQRLLHARELVKLRFLGFDRDERAVFCERIAGEGRCECVGAMGHTALFYRTNPDPALRRIAVPE